jgi:rRNA maturation endonuclease Nob1
MGEQMKNQKEYMEICEECEKKLPTSQLKECAGSGCASTVLCLSCVKENEW